MMGQAVGSAAPSDVASKQRSKDPALRLALSHIYQRLDNINYRLMNMTQRITVSPEPSDTVTKTTGAEPDYRTTIMHIGGLLEQITSRIAKLEEDI
jgi:hypothetical protein